MIQYPSLTSRQTILLLTPTAAQDNLQQPMPMSNLPNENDAGNLLIEEIQGIDIDGADDRLAPDEDDLRP